MVRYGSAGVNRKDDIAEGRAGVKYFATKWLEFGASYRYQYDRSTARVDYIRSESRKCRRSSTLLMAPQRKMYG